MAKKIDQKTILTIGAVGLGIYILYKPIKKIFDTFGITQSETSKAIEQQQTNVAKSPWSPGYWKTIKGAHLLTIAQANAKAKAIEESIGYVKLKPDFSKILAIFKTLTYKTQVSFLAERFAALYKTDLLDYLRNGKSSWFAQNALSESQIQILIDLENKLK